MGWEQRGAHQYYYCKEREGSRVKSVYVGRGEITHLNAALLAMEQQDCKMKREKGRQELECLNTHDADIDTLSRLTSVLTEVVLITAGFHQHNRQWRKRR